MFNTRGDDYHIPQSNCYICGHIVTERLPYFNDHAYVRMCAECFKNLVPDTEKKIEELKLAHRQRPNNVVERTLPPQFPASDAFADRICSTCGNNVFNNVKGLCTSCKVTLSNFVPLANTTER
jgi:hypothetical protein